MPDITDPAPIPPMSSATDKPKRDKEKRRQFHEEDSPPLHEKISDVTMIMGIPVDEVTPKVQEVFATLMNDIDHLRDQLNFAHDHIAKLQALSEEHSFLPLMNHRGLLKELSRIISLGGQTETENSFLCLHFRNVEDIRDRHGYNAVKSVLVKAAEILNDNLFDTDIIGSLGGTAIGVILTVTGGDQARIKAAHLVTALEDHEFGWQDGVIRLKTACGVHVLSPDESAEDAIDAADRDLTHSGDDIG